MKKLYPFLSIFIIPAALIFYSWSPGGSPGGKTGSPGDNGATCTECHGGTATFQEFWITSNIPSTGFVPGDTYTIVATGIQDGVQAFGFELTAEDNEGGKLGGFTITDTERTRLTNGVNAVTHTLLGNIPSGGANAWSMDWTAPEEDIGSVSFYAAFNASMGGNVYNVYTSSLTVNQSSLGIADNLLAEKVLVYPNPATDRVNINSPQGAELRLVDILGHELRVIENAAATEQLDISNLKDGIYFIQILHEGAQASKRLMKN